MVGGGGGVDLGGNEVSLGGVGGVIDDDFGAEFGEMESNGSADSSGTAGYDCQPVLEWK